MPGTITVSNATNDGNCSYRSGIEFDAIIAGMKETVVPGESCTFSTVPYGMQTLNFDPKITGMRSSHVTVNVSEDFNKFSYVVNMDGLDWKMKVVVDKIPPEE